MKILLDENIDIRLKQYFPEKHEVYTIRDMSWNGIKNGTLLQLLAENKFDCWIVVDKNIPYQQNMETTPCIIIVLNVFRNTLTRLLPLLPRLMIVLENDLNKKLVVIDELD